MLCLLLIRHSLGGFVSCFREKFFGETFEALERLWFFSFIFPLAKHILVSWFHEIERQDLAFFGGGKIKRQDLWRFGRIKLELKRRFNCNHWFKLKRKHLYSSLFLLFCFYFLFLWSLYRIWINMSSNFELKWNYKFLLAILLKNEVWLEMH